MSQLADKQQVLDLIKEWLVEVPKPLGQAILGNIRPSIRLVPPENLESHLPIGASRIGGEPDLPEGTEWPTFRGYAGKPNARAWEKHIGSPLPFVAQIRLDEMVRFDEESLLPKTGMLYIFYLESHDAFGLYAEYGEVFEFIYASVTPSSLSRVTSSSKLPFKLRYDGHRVEPQLEWTLPNPYDLITAETPLEMVDSNLRFWDHKDELRLKQGLGPFNQPRHRLLGYPDLIQTFRLDSGSQLLLQLDSDSRLSDYPKTGIHWGDGGRVYILIKDDDLSAGRLDRAWAYSECT